MHQPPHNTLTLHFDIISPYAYLCWSWLPDFCTARRVELVLRPVLFAGLLRTWGQLGPAEIPPKRAFLLQDIARRAARRGVPLTYPDPHPFHPLCALRVSTREVAGASQAKVVDALFRMVWGTGHSPTPERVAAALDAAGLDGEAMVARTAAPEVKAQLRDNTQALIEAGGFGVPTITCGGELFWGSDQEEALAAWVDRGERGYDAERVAAHVARGPGVVREQ